MTQYIYLDNCSTTKTDPRVLDAMIPFFTELYGNASSNHLMGTDANQHVERAREQIAQLIHSSPKEIIFTSGATESINIAIKGIAISQSDRNQIVTVSTEHKAVLDTCKYLEEVGYEIIYLAVNSEGMIDLEELEEVVNSQTLLVSIMLVNNETGVIQPIKKASDIAHKNGALFMTDATQAFGKIPIDVDNLGIDLMAFSAHKIYGPKGVGGLFYRNRYKEKIKLHPLIHGGGHESDIRSGTLNVPGIVGLGRAAELANYEMEHDENRIGKLRGLLESNLLDIENTRINGSVENRLYNVSNILFKNVDSDQLIASLKNIIVSNGSACTSSQIEPSHVLLSMGLNYEDASSCIRFSLGRFNTEEEVSIAVNAVSSEVKKARANLVTVN